MDDFYEQLLPADVKSSYKVINALAYIFTVLSLIFISIFLFEYLDFINVSTYLSVFNVEINPLLIYFSIFLMIAITSLIIKKKLYIEYEYIFTDGIIDIDIIYEEKKRKNLMSFETKDIEIMALKDSDYIKDISNEPGNEKHWYTSAAKDDIYLLIISSEDERIQIYIAPDDEFVSLCFKHGTGSVKNVVMKNSSIKKN